MFPGDKTREILAMKNWVKTLVVEVKFSERNICRNYE